jgi:hypothetical protein
MIVVAALDVGASGTAPAVRTALERMATLVHELEPRCLTDQVAGPRPDGCEGIR